MAELKTNHERRVELLSDARVLIAWLEAHPEVPLDGVHLRYSVLQPNDKSGIEEIESVARAAGTDVVENGSHHEVHATFGKAHYQATYIDRDHMAEYSAHMDRAPWTAAS